MTGKQEVHQNWRISDTSRPETACGGFPNRAREFQSKFQLISQDLRQLNSLDSHVFVVIVHQQHTSNLENRAKVLETLEERWLSGLKHRFAKPTCPVCTR